MHFPDLASLHTRCGLEGRAPEILRGVRNLLE
jgi:hypothetical protein